MPNRGWSFIHDSPAAIMDAGRRSVRRWRHNRIVRDIPGLVPDTVDAGQLAKSGRTVLVDFADVTSSVCKQRGPSKQVPFWSASYRCSAVSAMCGGQWTQAYPSDNPLELSSRVEESSNRMYEQAQIIEAKK